MEILEMSTDKKGNQVLLPTIKQLQRIDELIQHPALSPLYIEGLSLYWDSWIGSRKKAGNLINVLKNKIADQEKQ
jgi:hypothetical protein